MNYFYSNKNTISTKSICDYIFDLVFVFNILGDDFIPVISGFNPDTDMEKLFNALNNITSGNILDTKSNGDKKINFNNRKRFYFFKLALCLKQLYPSRMPIYTKVQTLY
jgi:hypothetical protein